MIESQGFTANLQIPFSEIPQFSDFDKWYAYPENQKLLLFENPPNLEGIANALKARKEYQIDRNLLADTVAEQYQSLKIDGKSNEIDSLRAENTFAITCAHQPNVFTGPVFFIYKLLSTIKLAEQCNKVFPEAKFVPILYLGSEDHDVAEINHIHLFGKRIEWPTSGTGAVGRIPCTELEDVKEEIYKILGDSVHADELKALIDSCYSPDNTLAEAITLFLHHLLPQYPFLIFNPDNEKIKNHFIDIIEADILKSESYPLVLEGQEQMAGYGLKTQAYVRPINFFYLGPNFRERIEYLDGKYHVLNRDITFTIDEIKAEIKGHPERFSPNVILRPLLQDLILPTIAFVGGGGELAYWADRRLLFKHFNIPFPVLIRRDSVLVLDQNSLKKIEKFHFKISDLLHEEHEIKTKFITFNEAKSVDFEAEREIIKELSIKILQKTGELDPSLNKFTGAELNQFHKIIDNIEAKLVRSLKNQNEVGINQILNVRRKILPDDQLQERHENFMSYYVLKGKSFFEEAYDILNPLDFKMKVLV